MNEVFRRVSICAAIALAWTLAPNDARAREWNVCLRANGGGVISGPCSPTLSKSNGKQQHPEIALAFWESQSNQVWTNATNSPTRSSFIASTLSLVNNGQYWSKVDQYATLGGAQGIIAPPRLAPYATIYTGTVLGDDPTNFTTTDINQLISVLITTQKLPVPQALDNSIYLVVVPAGSPASAKSGLCATDGCCNFPGTYNGTPYIAAFCGDPAGVSHELVEAIASYEGVGVTNNCGGDKGNGGFGDQIVDPCGCYVENQNSFPVAAYWSVADNKCVIPESWGPLNESNSGFGTWSSPAGSFNMRQGYGGAGGVVATNAVENTDGSGNNASFYNGSEWLLNISPGGAAQFAAGGGIVAALSLDGKTISYYRISSGSWTNTGFFPNGAVTGLTVTANGVMVATDPFANPWYYDPGNPFPAWHQIAGPGDQFIASGTKVLALNPSHNNIFLWTGPGAGFSSIGPTNATQLVSTPDNQLFGATSPGSSAFNFSGVALDIIGSGWQLGSIAGGGSEFSVLSGSDHVGVCQACGFGSPVTNTSIVGGWLMSSNVAYVTGCIGNVAPCVDLTVAPASEFGAPKRWSNVAFDGTVTNLMADVNGDGLADAVGFRPSSIYVMLSNGFGFGAPQEWSAVPFDGTVTNLMADANGDGLADAIGFNTNNIYVMLSNGSSFGAPQEWSNVPFDGTVTNLMSDVNGDGLADAVGFRPSSIYVMLSNGVESGDGFGGNSFAAPQEWSAVPFDGTVTNLMADVNGDGLADAVGFNTSNIYVMLSNGSRFGAPKEWSSTDFFEGTVTTLMADVNGDGLADAVAFDPFNIYVMLSNGSSFGAVQQWSNVAFDGTVANLMADVNNDGHADAVGFNSANSYVMLSQ
jgi:hypothetical protein